MSDAHHPRKDPDDLGRVARELLGDFLDDANAGQRNAISAAAKRVLRSEKAAPVRQFVRELDEVNGYLLSRALTALLSSRTRKGG
jgi:hypothetical protein